MKDKLFRLALSIVRERAEAEDVLQDVLLKLWSRRDEWSKIENLEAYCFRSVKNSSIDRIAAKATRKTETIDQDKENYYFTDHVSPYNKLVQKEQNEVINRFIDTLSENQKMVFQLREIEGMSYKEISETLNISEDLVKTSLFRARKRMKELLTEFNSKENL